MEPSKHFSRELDKANRIYAAILMLVTAFFIPIAFGLYAHALPSIQQFTMAALPLFLITAPTAVSEILAYGPVLGSGSYLAFSTGNIMTMRVTSQMNAASLAGSTPGTEEYDLISTYAIAISVIVSVSTMMVITLLLIPLSPVLTSPIVSDAAKFVLPVLFGSMIYNSLFGKNKGTNVTKKWMVFLIPFTLVMLFIYLVGPLGQNMGFVMLGSLPVTILTAYGFYKAGWVTLEEKKKESLPDK